MTTWEEPYLIEACKKEDRLAQRALFDRYFRYVVRIGQCFFDDPDELKELVNDVFCKIFQKIGSFEGENLKGWIGTIAKNLAIDYARKHRRAAANSIFHDELFDRGVPPVVLSTLEWEDFARLFSALTPMAKNVLEHFLKGFKHREIAQALNISVEQSKWHLHQSRQTLGMLLHQSDQE